MVKEFAARHGSGMRGLAAIAGMLATAAAVIVGAILAVFAAATVAVIAVMTSALLALAGLALRAGKVRGKTAQRQDGVIEARHQGGHHWVAYGWNERN